WRSVAPRVETEPLAMCDGATIPETGFIANQRRYRDRTAETYHIAHNPAHRWYYFPLMTRDEALVFKVFDTARDAGVRFTAHTSFDDPTSAPDAAIRESIEMRAFAFF
ncbi:MAG: methyltransferase, partial [Rhodospirillaceae bacterium]|nr:methyltransferase [Rhodospirillaceae bacterium]